MVTSMITYNFEANVTRKERYWEEVGYLGVSVYIPVEYLERLRRIKIRSFRAIVFIMVVF